MNTKRYTLTLISIILGSIMLSAQPKGVSDFIVTDVYGFEHKLYDDYLDKGKYVFLDFFWNSCGGCQESAPKIDSVYLEYGCNTGDIVFLAIDRFSPDWEIWDFKIANGMSFPAVSGEEGEGEKVHLEYGIQYVPYLMLISPAPEYRPLIDAYSIQSTQELRDTLNNLGFSETTCTGNDFDFFALTSETDSVTGTVFKKDNYVEVIYNPDNKSDYTAFFVPSGNAVVTLNGEEQISGISPIDPSQGTLSYLITAENGESREWTVEFFATNDRLTLSEPEMYLNPNPVNAGSVVSVISREKANAKLIVTDINGRVLNQENNITILSGENRIPFAQASDLPKGLYFLSIQSRNFIKTIRFVR